MTVTFSRRQLHELVWERPLTKLAAEFGISDVALRKICIRNRVPTPPVGFWAKRSHGKPVRVAPLPDPEEERTIRIGQVFGQESNALVEARAAVLDALENSVALSAEDPIVERTIAKLSQLKSNRDGLVCTSGARLIRVAVRPESIGRAGQLLRALARAGERADIRMGAVGNAVAWHVEGQTVGFELFEAHDRLPHVATAAELAAQAKWQKDREDYFRRHGYWKDWGEPKNPQVGSALSRAFSPSP